MQSIRQILKLFHCPSTFCYTKPDRQQDCGAKPTRNRLKMAELLDSNIKTDLNEKEFLRSSGYVLGRCIGEGTYSKVYAAIKILEGPPQRVAVKMIQKRLTGSEFIHKFLPRELDIIRNLQHENIVHLHQVFSANDTIFIIMDYCHDGDLLEYIRNRGPLTESLARHFFRQIVNAIAYLHNMDIAHRDIKCENILLSDLHVKLGDFGFTRSCVDENGKQILSKTFCGSAAYAAPEIIQGVPYDPKMYDIWSLGCVLYIMITATMPFNDDNVKKMLKSQLNRNLCPSSYVDWSQLCPNLRTLIGCLLEPEVQRRADIKTIENCLWLQSDDAIIEDYLDNGSFEMLPISDKKIDLQTDLSKSRYI